MFVMIANFVKKAQPNKRNLLFSLLRYVMYFTFTIFNYICITFLPT